MPSPPEDSNQISHILRGQEWEQELGGQVDGGLSARDG